MRFKKTLILILALLPWIELVAEDEYYQTLFEQGNAAYKSGQYDSARSIYMEIAQSGMVSSKLFYNIGNAHFKGGNIPASILYYERALRLKPNDEDIKYNLNIAEGFITDKIEPIEPVFIAKWWNELALNFTTNFWAIFFLVLMLISAALFTVFFLSPKRRKKQLGLIGSLVAMIVAVGIFLLGNTSLNNLQKQEAIVFAPSVNVKSEPGLNATDQFVIHQGLKVMLLAEDGDWTRIKLSDGNSGWLPTQSIEPI
ncbi:MAG: tetratricopeptide repeat protein [Salibacteraceae bacterium]